MNLDERVRRLEAIVAVAWPGEPVNLDPSVQRAHSLIKDIRKELGFPDDYDPGDFL